MEGGRTMKRVALVATLIASLILSLWTSASIANAKSAQVTIELEDASLRVVPPAEAEPTWPTLLEMNESTAFGALEMAFVSIMVDRIEKARKPKGARQVGAAIAKEKYGWGRYQFSCLDSLWTKESHWNYRARNPRTGAHGIPQALPATRMDIISTDWRTNPITQIEWGLRYIDIRYETPCRALSKFKRSRYY